MSGSVLVVDDEEIVRNSVRQWLELGGFTVRAAAGADEAMRPGERPPARRRPDRFSHAAAIRP
ncbi:hypothetical protein [Bradyrhizobium sp. USDA 4470]